MASTSSAQPVGNKQWLDRIEQRLAHQLRFLLEADRLKTVLRGNRLADGSRRENTAEHSWHLTLFAAVLSEWSAEPVDVLRVVQMLLIHDLVEIEAGDTPLFAHDEAHQQNVAEEAAADKLFGMLPADQGEKFRSLWQEFEGAVSPDARFAKALDRFQPILLNHLSGGGTWLDYKIDEGRERELTSRIAYGSPMLWMAAEEVFRDAVKAGWLLPASSPKGEP